MTKTSWIGSIVLCASLLAGCVGGAALRSPLPFPDGPQLHGHPGTGGEAASFCFPREDAVALAKWMDKLEAFRHAYERQH